MQMSIPQNPTERIFDLSLHPSLTVNPPVLL